MKINKHIKGARGQSAIGRLFSRGSNGPQSKKTRIKRAVINVPRFKQFTVTLRRFRTNSSRRSKTKKQLVVRLPLSSFRELAIEISRYKKPKARGPKPAVLLKVRIAGLSLLALGLLGTFYFGANLTKHVELEPVASAQTLPKLETPPPAPKSLPASEPTKLRISRLNIDTDLSPVGLKKNGSMEVPNFELAGWYRYSPTPGEIGPSVIVGHVDSPKGPAVFWRLRELIPGDEIEVERADSTVAKFRIDKVENYPRDSIPSQAVYGDTDYAGIRLMTCGGVFDKQTQHYDQNTVVFGTLI